MPPPPVDAAPPVSVLDVLELDELDESVVVDAARGVGMRESEILFQVEIPNAMPLIFGGIRSAALQVVATATIAAYVGLGGLGRYVFDGLAREPYTERARIRMDTGYVAQTAREAVRVLCSAHGASSFAESSPLQRIWRDLEVCSRHAVVSPEITDL